MPGHGCQQRQRTKRVLRGRCRQPVAGSSKEPRDTGSVEWLAWADGTCQTFEWSVLSTSRPVS
jgi:hypothetical protein